MSDISDGCSGSGRVSNANAVEATPVNLCRAMYETIERRVKKVMITSEESESYVVLQEYSEQVPPSFSEQNGNVTEWMKKNAARYGWTWADTLEETMDLGYEPEDPLYDMIFNDKKEMVRVFDEIKTMMNDWYPKNLIIHEEGFCFEHDLEVGD